MNNDFFRSSGHPARAPRLLSRPAFFLALYGFAAPMTASANPYLAKAGETPTTVQVATCAVSGGFIHLYTAMDNGLFDKYGIKIDHKFISGSAVNLAALSADEVSFLYCAADGTIPGLASGVDGKLVASPLIGLPYVLLAHKDIKRLEDLKGKSIGVSKAGDLDDRLMKTMLKKFNLSAADVTIRPIGGSQPERYNAMMGGIVQAAPVTPLRRPGKKGRSQSDLQSQGPEPAIHLQLHSYEPQNLEGKTPTGAAVRSRHRRVGSLRGKEP